MTEISGYRMPAEYEPHDGCLMIWPTRPGSWRDGVAARAAFTAVAAAIAESEQVYMLADGDHVDEARAALPESVIVLPIESDDAWSRDVGPTFVVDDCGGRAGLDWQFNAWGGTVDGLYPHWERDDRVASAFCAALGERCVDMHPFVLEGGSIHSDGEGTLLVTEACLLSKGRNPSMTKAQIEQILCRTLGAQKVVWLPCGIYNDETNEHVDNIAAFVGAAQVVLAWSDDPADPQYAMSRACEDVLLRETDARGRTFTVHHLPIPAVPVTVSAADMDGYVFEDGEDTREVGERLAASYVNFYIANDSVVLPQFGDVNDAVAVEILQKLFPTRRVRPIAARDILLGGGNIHCITQQIPKRRSRV